MGKITSEQPEPKEGMRELLVFMPGSSGRYSTVKGRHITSESRKAFGGVWVTGGETNALTMRFRPFTDGTFFVRRGQFSVNENLSIKKM